MTLHRIVLDYSWSKDTQVSMKEAYQDYKSLLIKQNIIVGKVWNRSILRGNGKTPKIKKMTFFVERL
jgi:hypothetical protein